MSVSPISVLLSSNSLHANLYESVAVQISLSLAILKLIPVKTGLDSCVDVAKIVWLIVFLNNCWLITIGDLLNSKSKFGNSLTLLQFNLNEDDEVVKQAAFELDNVKSNTEGKEIKKVIVVKNRIVNIVAI